MSVLKKLIAAPSNPRDVVLDPFMGVGSTAEAALELGRNFLGCELDPKYVKVARERLRKAFPEIYRADTLRTKFRVPEMQTFLSIRKR